MPGGWLRHAGAKPREEVDYSAARQDTSSDRDCRFDQKEESSMIGRDLFNIPCRICRRPTIHRTRTRHPERKSKSEGHCGSYRAGRERRNSQIPTSTQALLPTSTHSNGFCIIRVCISSSSSSSSTFRSASNYASNSNIVFTSSGLEVLGQKKKLVLGITGSL